jgi:hypothetical protein
VPPESGAAGALYPRHRKNAPIASMARTRITTNAVLLLPPLVDTAVLRDSSTISHSSFGSPSFLIDHDDTTSTA